MDDVLLARITAGFSTASASFSTLHFQIELLGDGLDGKFGDCQRAHVRRRLKPRKCGGFLSCRDFLFLHFAVEILGNIFEAAIQESLFHVTKNHGVARARKHMRDAVSHRPGAKDGHRSYRID